MPHIKPTKNLTPKTLLKERGLTIVLKKIEMHIFSQHTKL